jgi:hypothetical protein
MRYRISATLVREDWMTLTEPMVHICSAKEHSDEKIARRELVNTLTQGLQPLRWQRERDDRALPVGRTSTIMPTDTPPLGRDWPEAKIRWSTGRVRHDWRAQFPRPIAELGGSLSNGGLVAAGFQASTAERK